MRESSCAEVLRSFPTMPCSSRVLCDVIVTLGDKGEIKRRGFSFLTPSPIQWRHTQLWVSAGKALVLVYANSVYVNVRVCLLWFMNSMLPVVFGVINKEEVCRNFGSVPHAGGIRSKSKEQVALWLQKPVRKWKLNVCSESFQSQKN